MDDKAITSRQIRTSKDLLKYEITETAIEASRLYALIRSRLRVGKYSDISDYFENFMAVFEHLYLMTCPEEEDETLIELFDNAPAFYVDELNEQKLNVKTVEKYLKMFRAFRKELIRSGVLDVSYKKLKPEYAAAEGLED